MTDGHFLHRDQIRELYEDHEDELGQTTFEGPDGEDIGVLTWNGKPVISTEESG